MLAWCVTSAVWGVIFFIGNRRHAAKLKELERKLEGHRNVIYTLQRENGDFRDRLERVARISGLDHTPWYP